MSNTAKKPIAQVLPIARKLIDRFSPHCEHIELGGSLRREKSMIGDIEICCIPASVIQYDLFNEPVAEIFALYDVLDELLENGAIKHAQPRKCWGTKNRRFTFETRRDTYSVDLYMWTKESWVFNFMIKTGPRAFSQKMVTPESKGGYLPDGWTIKNGFQIYDEADQLLPVATERDIFDHYGMSRLEPKDRR